MVSIVIGEIQNNMINLIANQLIKELKAKNSKIAFAETITGGGLAKAIIEIPGASDIIDYSVVVYSNESKIEQLKVNKKTLETNGAVSEQTVYEMAIGLRNLSHANINVAISGIAGPSGCSVLKPVGMTCVAIDINGLIKTYSFIIKGNERKEIINNAIEICLKLVIDSIKFD